MQALKFVLQIAARMKSTIW